MYDCDRQTIPANWLLAKLDSSSATQKLARKSALLIQKYLWLLRQRLLLF
jgi:hypothetical protein